MGKSGFGPRWMERKAVLFRYAGSGVSVRYRSGEEKGSEGRRSLRLGRGRCGNDKCRSRHTEH